MKKRIVRSLVLIALSGVVLSLAGCSLLGTTMTERIEQFIDDINGQDYTAVRANLDSGASDYATAPKEFWQAYFDETETHYSVSNINEGSSSATATISGGDWGSGTTFTFTFVESDAGLFGKDYLISRIEARTEAGLTLIFN